MNPICDTRLHLRLESTREQSYDYVGRYVGKTMGVEIGETGIASSQSLNQWGTFPQKFSYFGIFSRHEVSIFNIFKIKRPKSEKKNSILGVGWIWCLNPSSPGMGQSTLCGDALVSTVEGKSKWHHQAFQDSFLLKR